MKASRITMVSVVALVLGCGGHPALKSLFPSDGAGGGTAPAVGAYVKAGAGFQTAEGYKAIDDLIDGEASPYFKANGDASGKSSNKVLAMARESYTSSSHDLSLKVWQFADAASAATTYDYLFANEQFYKDQTWTDLTVAGAKAARIAQTTNAGWDICAYAGSHFLEVKVSPADDAGKADAQAFSAAVLSKL